MEKIAEQCNVFMKGESEIRHSPQRHYMSFSPAIILLRLLYEPYSISIGDGYEAYTYQGTYEVFCVDTLDVLGEAEGERLKFYFVLQRITTGFERQSKPVV